MNFINKFFTFLGFFIIYFVLVNLLEVDVQVSENVQAGGNATLRCLFNCDNKEIVTLKWYRGNREFYRYMPSTYPSINVFPFTVGGILDVDIRNSNATQVTLRNISVFLSGQFTCEVTAGQNLTTVSAYSNLYVYDAAVFAKPTIKYDNTRQNVLCSGIQLRQPVKKFSTVFYVDNDKISQSNVTYDNNTIILNTSSLLDWNNGKSKVIRCEVDLPGTTPTSSDEIIVQIDTNDIMVVFPPTFLICIGCILPYFSDVLSS